MLKSKILIIMTGSIAAYKTCHVISRLVQNDFEVRVVATSAALKFIGAATIEGLTGQNVYSDLYETEQMMAHIHLIRWADLILCAPATANYINKISHGVGDDLASTLFLAHDFKKPFLIAPAMNTNMYLHPITQKSIEHLKSLQIDILETASGVLACGEKGYGKLLDPELILKEITDRLTSTHSVKNTSAKFQKLKKILITAGGTSENIDDVRSITNTSTGKTGYALAKNLWQFGYDVTLLLSANAKIDFEEFEIQRFTDFNSLSTLLEKTLSAQKYDFIFHLAAVSDYSVKEIRVDGKTQTFHKIPSSSHVTIELKPNPKLVNRIKSSSLNSQIKLISFKLTSEAGTEEKNQAVQKLMLDSQSDFVVHNELSEMDQNKNQHIFTVFANRNEPAKVFTAQNIASLTDYFVQEIL